MDEAQLSLLLAALSPWSMGIVLAMARAGGLVLGLPHLGSKAVPRAIAVLVVLALGIGLMGVNPNVEAPSSLLGLAMGVLIEFGFGFGLGFVVQLALAAPRIAGELAGIEMGLSFAAIADPLSGGQSTALSSLLGQLGIQLFLALGLDRFALLVLLRTADRTALGDATLHPGTFSHLVSSGDAILSAAFGFALPIMAALLSLKLAMAMLARIAPKLQIFSLAFALSSGVGILMLHAVLPSVAAAMTRFLWDMMELLARVAGV